MFRYALIAIGCVIGGACSANPLHTLNLTLRLDSMGFSDVEVYDNAVLLDQFEFLDVEHDIWGITKPHEHFEIGNEVVFNATLSEFDEQLSSCQMGGISCINSFGQVLNNEFTISDGMGFASWGDFHIEGGTNVGDRVILATFDGLPTYEYRGDDGYVVWNAFVQNFMVVGSDTSPSDDLSAVPLPASVLFLVAAMGSIGCLSRYRERFLAQDPICG